MVVFGLVALPFVVGGVGYFVLRRTVTWKEYLAYTGISLALVVTGWFIAMNRALKDVEHLGGRVAEKIDEEVPCCHCTTRCRRRGEDMKCERWETDCQHSRDRRYALVVDTGEAQHEIDFEACSRPVPPRQWAAARVGEPAVVEHSYQNYLAADEHSLLRDRDAGVREYLERIPQFPKLRDLYRVDRVVPIGVAAPPSWQATLDEHNARLGPTHQVDITVVLTDWDDPESYRAVEAKWNYGPKNAVIVVIGAPDGRTVAWAGVVSISRVGELEVALRERLRGMSLAGDTVPDAIAQEVDAHFTRTPMSELRYLAGAASPGLLATILLYVLDVGVIVLLVWLAHRHDPFGDGPRRLVARVRQRASKISPLRIGLELLKLKWRMRRR